MRTVLAFSTAALLISVLSAGAQNKQAIQKEVEVVDAARVEALKKGDGNAWGKTIADDCLWVNMATGEVEQNKTERIKSISESGGLDIRPSTDVKYHVEETRVVQTGASPRSGQFARIYVKDGGVWRMIALYQENVPSE